jgi:general secretion pathway protein D
MIGAGGAAATLLVGACATPHGGPTPSLGPAPAVGETVPAHPAPRPVPPRSSLDRTGEPASTAGPTLYRGTGEFVGRGTVAAAPTVAVEAGDVVLNFQGADLREVVDVMLGEVLEANYVIDPTVAGTVTLQTSRPIHRDAVLPLLERLLWMNGATLVEDDHVYRIAPRVGAGRGGPVPRLPDRRNLLPGYQIAVVPLRFVSAREMERILEPFVNEGAIALVDERRNLLLLAGTGPELQSWLETVAIFDVDWLRGTSVGLFPLENATAETIAAELEQILGQPGDAERPGLIRIEPVERLNALLVVTPQPRYLDRVRVWVERLDRVEGGPGLQLFVYRVRNREAAELAEVLNAMYGEGQEAAAAAPAGLAPGMRPVSLESPGGLDGGGELGADTYATKQQAATRRLAAEIRGPREAAGPGEGLALPGAGGVRITADSRNNTLLILAAAADYRGIEMALRKLDVVPMQVLIETSIVQVNLTDELRYGVEWAFRAQGEDLEHNVLLDLGGPGIGALVPGFSYTILGRDVQAALNLFAQDSRLNVLSSPSILVRDGETAQIRVGDQVPVRTETAVTEGGTTVESIQFKDTGVLLSVQPRVNAGGLVTLEVSQEVTDVGNVDPATGQRTFLQRNVQSSVAVQSGQTVVLGGLITENISIGESGIPVLYKLPVVGKLFGQTEETTVRTELLVILTPRVVRNQQEAADITEELRQRMKRIASWPQGLMGQSASRPQAR